MDAILQQILKNPAVMGALIAAGIKWLHGFLVSVDQSGKAKQWAPQLHIAFLVLSFIASLAQEASVGTLGSTDLSGLSTFLTYWVQVLVGGKAMSVSHGVPWQEKLTGKK